MKQPNFFIGPMTQNVIDACIEFSNETNCKLGFIASRRQIDENGGYVGYRTEDFIKYVKYKTNNILVCRDHSGPLQGQLSNSPRVYDKDSLETDALNGMDIIHIDPWKLYNKYEEGLNETINEIFFVNYVNKKVRFEIGTEEAIRRFETDEFYKLLRDLKFNLGNIFDNIQYAVIQSGTRLFGTKNVGSFDNERLKEMIDICKSFNILSKEHNGDYLSNAGIKYRFDNDLDAINIAPEFGVIETKIILQHANDKQFFQIYNVCFEGGKWKKWLNNGFGFDFDSRKKELIEVCGHYHNKQLKEIIGIDDNIIKTALKEKLKDLHT